MDDKISFSEYNDWIKSLKSKIHAAKRKIALSINSQLLELYWEIGKDILEKQENSNWGSKLIERTSIELKHEFPEIKGFSRRNLYAIRQWYKFYSEKFSIVPQSVAQIPWGHNRLIITKVKNIDEALFYCNETIENGWDRETLEIQIENDLFKKKGEAITNFSKTLPNKQSKLANEALKDPYNFDFLGLHDEALEKAIEDELVKHITEFLLELGKGFAYLGRQYKIEISETDYFIDMLFYYRIYDVIL